ncbi:MAG: hypothetical protein H0Z33_06595 [Bacillaceae bacterium]|nr:hypothetical protein [Bacillaceae bacterium]
MKMYRASVFKDEHDTILMFPVGRDENGIPTMMNQHIKVDPPYTAKDVGENLLHCLEMSGTDQPVSSEEGKRSFADATGIKSFKKFSQNRLLVNVVWLEDRGYIFSANKRDTKGAYLGTGKENNLDSGAGAEAIGEMLLETFKLSSC